MQDNIFHGQVLEQIETNNPIQTFDTGARFVVRSIHHNPDGTRNYEVMDETLDPDSTLTFEPWIMSEFKIL